MNNILFGDCRQSLRELAKSGVKAQAGVTSPPYFGLRDYGVPPTDWPAMEYATLGGTVSVPAMSSCLGLEPTPDAFVGHLVLIFREVWDVLADDGTLWLNIGDSYCTTSTYAAPRTSGGEFGRIDAPRQPKPRIAPGLKAKDLIGIPWRVAFALQADGWYLRQDNIWNKSNPMPESVRDRCTKAHEYVFLLAKSERYYFDSEAIKEPAAASSLARWAQDVDKQRGSDRVPGKTNGTMKAVGGPRSARDSFKRDGSKRAEVIPGQSVGTHRPDREESTYDTAVRNKRSVWTVATLPYKGAHFATFPPALIEPCILAGSRPGDIVLDPFIGSGTTAQVAIKHGRQYLGCELNETNKPLQDARIEAAHEALLAAEAAAYTPQLDLFTS